MNQDVIYRALRGEASPEELEQVERWYMEDPEEFQRCADEAHLQIDMMELYGEQMRPTSCSPSKSTHCRPRTANA